MADHRLFARTKLAAGVVAIFGMAALAQSTNAQNRRWDRVSPIEPGTAIQVRSTEPISSNAADGRVYRGIVENDVMDRSGRLAIEAGSPAELMVRRVGDDDLAVDLDSVTVEGQRYAVRAGSNPVGTSGRSGIGVNRETGEYVGGGAVLGTIIGAIAGGAKGAAIGAGVGAAAGAGAQIATHGRSVQVPAETLLTYQLSQPLYLDVPDEGYSRDGVHYHRCPGC
jgi:hypothetical protein